MEKQKDKIQNVRIEKYAGSLLAFGMCVSHPHSGRHFDPTEEIHISEVLEIAEDGKSFETRNTIWEVVDDSLLTSKR